MSRNFIAAPAQPSFLHEDGSKAPRLIDILVLKFGPLLMGFLDAHATAEVREHRVERVSRSEAVTKI